MLKLIDKITKLVQGGVERFEGEGLGPREFTAVLPLRNSGGRPPLTELHSVLRALDAREPSPFATVAGLHSIRFLLVDQPDEGAAGTDVVIPSGPLVIGCVLDGEPLDVLRALVAVMGKTLLDVLSYCDGFDPTAAPHEIAAFLLAARARSGYFFSDVPDTSTEIRDALSLRDRFVAWYCEHQQDAPADLRRAFDEFRRDPGPRSTRMTTTPVSDAPAFGYPFALSRPFERAIPMEAKWVRRVVELTRRLQERDVYEARLTDVLARPARVAHTKHHGCVEASFVVHDGIPEELRHGIFAKPATFNALIRSSNTSNVPRPDGVFDGRGISIKVLDVGASGHSVLEEPPPDGLPGSATTTSQDFLMINHPAFFAKDIRDFAILRSILDVGTRRERILRALLFAAQRPRELRIFIKTFFTHIDHPFDITYHSTVPSLLGPKLAVKYSVSPVPGARPHAPPADRAAFDYLRDALQASLDPATGRKIELEFFVHVGKSWFPVEDAASDWEKLGARKVKVATISIEPQSFTSSEKMEQCENLVFSPWHALEAHKPLGSLSRARYAIYRASMEGRRGALSQKGRVAGAA